MPVINRRLGITGLPDSVIKQLVPRSISVSLPMTNPALQYIGKTDLKKLTNPSGATTRIVSGMNQDWYRPGGLLYRP